MFSMQVLALCPRILAFRPFCIDLSEIMLNYMENSLFKLSLLSDALIKLFNQKFVFGKVIVRIIV